MPDATRDTLPDLSRPDAHLVLLSTWTATPATQRAAADAALAWWAGPTGPAGALTHTCLLGDDGRSVVHYSQWAEAGNLEAFLRTGTAELDAIAHAIEGLVVETPVVYRLYRSMTGADRSATGCVVLVSVTFDYADQRRLERWIDGVFDAIGDDPPVAGGLAGHFHASLDGTRMLNFAEWTDAQAHARAMDRPLGSKWKAVHEFPGVVHADVRRFRPYAAVSRQPAAASAR